MKYKQRSLSDRKRLRLEIREKQLVWQIDEGQMKEYERRELMEIKCEDAVRAALHIVENEALDITEEKIKGWYWANLFEWIEEWGYKWIGGMRWSDNEELEIERQRLERIEAKKKFKMEGPS